MSVPLSTFCPLTHLLPSQNCLNLSQFVHCFIVHAWLRPLTDIQSSYSLIGAVLVKNLSYCPTADKSRDQTDIVLFFLCVCTHISPGSSEGPNYKWSGDFKRFSVTFQVIRLTGAGTANGNQVALIDIWEQKVRKISRSPRCHSPPAPNHFPFEWLLSLWCPPPAWKDMAYRRHIFFTYLAFKLASWRPNRQDSFIFFIHTVGM